MSKLKVSPEREAEIKRLFKEGLDKAGKNPMKYWKARQTDHAKIKPWPGLQKAEKEGAEEDLDKALFIGPRGGKWADPQHTIPWDPKKHGARAEKVEKKKFTKISPEKLREQIQLARDFLDKHEQLLPKVTREIQDLAGADAQVTSRAKQVESALNKVLVRKTEMYSSVTDIPDGAGFRVMHDSVNQVWATVEALKAKYDVINENDYITQPHPTGYYRSYHLIIRDKETSLVYEVQVRTRNQHVFSEWAHNIYKPLTPEQEKLKDTPEVQEYQARLADYFWRMDTGQDPGERPPCPPCVLSAFGCV